MLIGMEAVTPRGDGMSFRPWTELAREAALSGTQTKNATRERNVCETNLLLASPRKRPTQWKSTFFICLQSKSFLLNVKILKF